MPAIPYSLNIPNGPNNPSADWPKMQVNTNSTSAIIAVDHYTFADQTAGDHKQVTFSAENVPGAVTDPVSILYTNVGSAGTISELFYKNQTQIMCVSLIKMTGNIQLTALLSTIKNGIGFTISNYATNSIRINFNAALPSGFYTFLGTITGGFYILSYSAFNDHIILNFNALITGTQFLDFSILQA